MNFNDFTDRVVYGGDEFGYYVYLPALFLHHDLDNLQQTLAVKKTLKPASVLQDSTGLLHVGEAPLHDGNPVIKYTYGVSLLHLPGFLAGHLIASLSDDHPAHGLSPPYLASVFTWVILFIALGLYVFGLFLDYYVPDWATNLALLTLAFATTLWYFSVCGVMMSHGVQFTLWSVLLYSAHRYWMVSRKWRHLIMLALSGSLITLIRPPEIFVVAVALSTGAASFEDIRDRIISFFREYRSHLLGAIIIGLLVVSPQLLYWHAQTGHFLYDSYPNESFDFTNPHLIKGLFGWGNGLFTYSPLLLLSLPGWYFFVRSKPSFALVTATAFFVYAYVSYSWWCWMYVNGMGSRVMVDIYPLLSIPLGYFIFRVFRGRRALFVPMLVAGMFLVTFWTWQSNQYILYSDFANWNYMRQSFLDTVYTQQASVAYDTHEFQPEVTLVGEPLYAFDFEADSGKYETDFVEALGSQALRIDRNGATPFHIIVQSDTLREMRAYPLTVIDMTVYAYHQTSDFWNMNTLEIRVYDDDKLSTHKYVRLNNKTGQDGERSWTWGKPDDPTNVRIVLPIKQYTHNSSSLEISMRNPDGAPGLHVDDLRISRAVPTNS